MSLGLTEREAKVFVALLDKRLAAISELQKLSGVPNSQIYRTIDSLVRQGFFTERQVNKKRTFEIIDPNLSLIPLLENIKSQLEAGNALKQELGELYINGESLSEPFEYIEVLHGNENIHNKFNQLQNAAKFEILGFTRPPFAYFTPEMQKEQFIATEKFMEKGGIARSVVEANDESPARIFKTIEQGMRMMREVDGSDQSELRVVAKLPIKMFIFDRDTLLITEKSSAIDETDLSMTVVKQKSMVEGYIALFDFLWDQGVGCDEWVANNVELFEKKLAELSH